MGNFVFIVFDRVSVKEISFSSAERKNGHWVVGSRMVGFFSFYALLSAAGSTPDAGAVGSRLGLLLLFGGLGFGCAAAFFLLGSSASLLIGVDLAGAGLRRSFLLGGNLLLQRGATGGTFGFLRASSSEFGFLGWFVFGVIFS